MHLIREFLIYRSLGATAVYLPIRRGLTRRALRVSPCFMIYLGFERS